MKQQHQNPPRREHGEKAPRTDQRAKHASSTDPQYGTHSSIGAPEHANADPPRNQPTRGGAQTGLTGSVGQLDSEAQTMQRPGGANPSAADAQDWQNQRGEIPDAADEQQRAAAASPGRVSQDQGGAVTVDRSEEGARDQARSTQGSAVKVYPSQHPGEAGGSSKYSPTANEQDRLSQRQGGAPLRDLPPDEERARREREQQKQQQQQQ